MGGSRNGEMGASTVAVFHSFFFFFSFCSFSKNITIKIQKIKSLFWGLQTLAPHTPPPQKSPVGKGSGEGLKKKREKPHFSVFFFLRRARSR